MEVKILCNRKCLACTKELNLPHTRSH